MGMRDREPAASPTAEGKVYCYCFTRVSTITIFALQMLQKLLRKYLIGEAVFVS